VIQKLFERTSPALRFAMLERIAPLLAMVGTHKNGTWAAQKIIECSVTDAERELVAANLRPYAPPLMCDSLGNYVCAGTLRFGEPFSDYVFDAMIDRMWDIAQNRFGARCMRTCLESPHASLYQRVSPSDPSRVLADRMAETYCKRGHPQLYPTRYEPQWCTSLDLAGGPVELAGKIRPSRKPLRPSHRPSLHAQARFPHCASEYAQIPSVAWVALTDSCQ